MAESRASWAVVMSGAFRGACACRRVGQLPDLTPMDFGLLARAMPAGSFGGSWPLSVAATMIGYEAQSETRGGEIRETMGPANSACRVCASCPSARTPWQHASRYTT